MNNYDIVIIGAGIVGLTTAYKLSQKDPSLKICILEKESSVAFHQTGHNSGVIHSGIYYKPGSLKAINCITGYKMLLDFCDENKIAYEICGKIIAATDEKELPALQTLYEKGVANGLADIKIISEAEVKEIEPNVKALKGIFVPQTGITDYKIISEKISDHLRSKGVEIRLDEEVKDIKIKNNRAEIKTIKNNFSSSVLISCAGLYSDKISEMINDKIEYKIIPFRGEYYNLKNKGRKLVRNLVYPVPDPEFPFLGVHFTRRTDGTTEAGPNAVFAFKKEGYKKSDFNFKETIDTLRFRGFQKIALKYLKTGYYEFYRSFSKKEFVRSLQKLVPAINGDDLIPGGSGVRAQACSKDGKLIDDFLFIENERVINVFNAPSPAATSSFSIGNTIAEKVLNDIRI